MERNILNSIRETIKNTDIDEQDKAQLLQNVLQIEQQKINILITGATGCGKSSTINALFGENIAEVGCNASPETEYIECYELDNLILWDSPGLGDSSEADARISENIIEKLNELDENDDPLIDLVLMVIDGSSRDLGTSYKLINDVIIPTLGEEAKDRLLVAINQADAAMKGRYWNYIENRPEPKLIDFLEKMTDTIHKRIYEETGIDVELIYYSAGFKEEDGEQAPPYNLSKLLYYIVKRTPRIKRLIYADNINSDSEAWEYSDNEVNYRELIKEIFSNAFETGKSRGRDRGHNFSEEIFSGSGYELFGTIGGTIGGVTEVLKQIGNVITAWLPF